MTSGYTKMTSSECIDLANITEPRTKKSKMSSEKEIENLRDGSHTNSVTCFIDVFEPGRYFSFGQCEWLLQFTSLRTVCKRAHVTGDHLGEICARWLHSEEPGEKWFVLTAKNRFPFIYNACRASLLQRWFLRFAQQRSGAIVAGSYPAAVCIHNKRQHLSWHPSDIDVWAPTRKSYEEIVASYEDLLASAGIPTVELDGDYPTDSEDDSNSEDNERKVPKNILETKEKRWFKYDIGQYGPTSQVEESLQTCASSAKSCGKRRPFKLRKSVKIRIDSEISGSKRWWQQLRVVNVIWISMKRKAPVSFGPAAICSGFDLSCCCVALQVQIDMTSRILCHYGSGHDLAKGTMYLLPCSFNNDVALQMLRVLKYVNRGFKLVGVAKDHHCCPRCELGTEK